MQGVPGRPRVLWGHDIADLDAGLADAAAWALDTTAELRLTQLQRVLTHAEADGPRAAVFFAIFMAGSGRSAWFIKNGQAAAARCMP